MPLPYPNALSPFGVAEKAELIKYIDTVLADNTAAIANLNAWATALATKLNAQFVVANAETTLPFSPALAVDYDTDPQA